MLKRWRHARKESQEMNLLPVMNLMVILIPALMLGAAFYHLGNIATSIPDNVPASNEKPPKDVKVTMSISIAADKLIVSGSGEGLDKAALAALDLDLTNVRGKRDFKRLQAHLTRIKKMYPKSDTVMLVPDDTTKYFDIVAVLDASRERKLSPAESKPGKEFEPLFPISSLTKKLIAAPDDEEAAGGAGGEGEKPE